MKRFILSFVMLGVCAMVTGCAEEAKKETKVEVKTPTGTETKKVVETDKKTGDAKDAAAK